LYQERDGDKRKYRHKIMPSELRAPIVQQVLSKFCVRNRYLDNGLKISIKSKTNAYINID